MFGPEFLYVSVVVVIAWLYDYYNGANDAANAIATTVSTRVLSPGKALALAALLNGAGAFVSTRVAKTIGKGIVDPELLGGVVLIAALIGAVVWVALSTRMGLPVSVTHALVGGIIGAVAIPHHFGVLKVAGLSKILLGIVLSPLLGLLGAALLLILLYALSLRSTAASVQRRYSVLQLVSAAWMALSHGMNDTQNAMAMITVALYTTGAIQEFEVPWWVLVGSGLFMALGTYAGGWRVIKTLGMRIAKIRPIHGFAAETAAGGVIMAATFLGIPISTTHAITGAVLGVSVAERPRAVRWYVTRDIVLAWIFTIPGSAILAGVVYALLRLFF
ncbi:MAG: inorganic phosphate transporter [Patescibacteria group bacterium]